MSKRQDANKKRREAKYGTNEPRKTQKFYAKQNVWVKPWEFEILSIGEEQA